MDAQTTHRRDDDTLQATHTKVRELLRNTQAFNDLPAEQRKEIAQNLVPIGSCMANPGGVLKEALQAPLAEQ